MKRFSACLPLLFLLPLFGNSLNKETTYYSSPKNQPINYVEQTPNGFLFGGATGLTYLDQNAELISQFDLKQNRATFSSVDNSFLFTKTYDGGSKAGFVLKHDLLGNEVWSTMIRDAHWRNFVTDIIQLNDSSYVYTGRHSSVTSSGADVRLLDLEGKVKWSFRWESGSGLSTHPRFIEKQDSLLIIAGVSNAGQEGQGQERDVFITWHSQRDGRYYSDFIWKDDNTQDVKQILPVGINELILLANSTATGTEGNDFIIKLRNRKTQWTKQLDLLPNESLREIRSTSDEGYIVLVNGQNEKDSFYTYLVKLDSIAGEEWRYYLPNIDQNHKGSGLFDIDNDEFVIAGSATNSSGEQSYFLSTINIYNLPSYISNNERLLEVNVYPNPTHNILNIQISNGPEIKGTILVFDGLGRKIDDFRIKNNHFQHSTEGWVPGIYYLRISTPTGNKIIKVIK